jgi:hypothetical protein
MKRAYRIFPMYSKNNDHAGPFKGCISVQPLMSRELPTGTNVNPINSTSNIFHTGKDEIRGKKCCPKVKCYSPDKHSYYYHRM